MARIKALSVQSLSGFGKCSLTEALPVISACGISLSVLPTVLLSTHTGGFSTPKRLDTTEFLKDAIEHYKAENIKFGGIYTGYFAETSQIEYLTNQIDNITEENRLVLVDPVLGDKGKFFSGITEEFLEKMLDLCKKADVILPNITESYLLCNEEYKEKPTEGELLNLAVKLYNITKAKVIITGVEKVNKIGALIFDGENGEFVYSKKVSAHFHGTGDIFSSVVFSLLLRGKTLSRAVLMAEKFILKAINKTVSNNTQENEGIDFEGCLKYLMLKS